MKRFGLLILFLFVSFVLSNEKITEENNYSARAIVFDTAKDESENSRKLLSGLFAGSCKNQKSQIAANDCAMSKCLNTDAGSYGSQSCIISMEGKKDVYKENISNFFKEKRKNEQIARKEKAERERIARIAKAERERIAELEKKRKLEKLEADYIAQKRNTCIKYGFKKDADIAECIRKSTAEDKANEIALKKIKEEKQKQLEKERQLNQQLAQQQYYIEQQAQAYMLQQQQQIMARSGCMMSGKTLQGGWAGTLEILGNCNRNPYYYDATNICNYANQDGIVIQGLCSNHSINIGLDRFTKIR